MANYPGKYLPGSGRQLMNLAKRPSASTIRDANGDSKVVADERPFFDLGEMPETHPDYGIEAPWRVLRWHPTTGEEVVAHTQSALNAFDHQGYVSFPPNQVAANPMASALEDLAGLTQDEKRRALQSVRDQKIRDLQQRLSKLSDHELESVAKAADQGRKTA